MIYKKFSGMLLLSILVLPLFAAAYGVSSPFWDTRPLVLQPGQTEDIILELQNLVGGNDILLRARVAEGAEIVTLLDENLDYYVPFGSQNVYSRVRISVPEDARDGQSWKVGILFTAIPLSEEGGMVQLDGGVNTAFPVVIKVPALAEVKEPFPAVARLVAAGII